MKSRRRIDSTDLPVTSDSASAGSQPSSSISFRICADCAAAFSSAFAARAAKADEKAAAQSAQILKLIDEEGWDPAEAESEVTGKSVESIRRRDFITQSRAEGHAGAGFDDLLSSVHQRMIDELAIAAEDATNGYMVKRQYMLKVSPKQLWSVNDATARKWMSDEMAAWFDENGRLTRSTLREMILSGSYSAQRFARSNQDYLQ